MLVEEHCSNYQRRDIEVVDYQMYTLDGTGLWFRGPQEFDRSSRGYISCVGAAQTLGCFCESPYPRLIAEQLGEPVLNLGYGGAGPRFFARQPEVIDYINRGRMAVLQIMSGRSEDNHLFSSGGLELLTRRSDGKQMGADVAWDSILESRYLWRRSPVAQQGLRSLCRAVGKQRLKRLVEETRQAWVDSYMRLLDQIEVPTVVLWFSRREPDYPLQYDRVMDIFGDYPQLVNEQMVAQVAARGAAYLKCTTRRGSPQPLVHRLTGEPVQVCLADDRDDFGTVMWSENDYYPSPEMHEDAARMILDHLSTAT